MLLLAFFFLSIQTVKAQISGTKTVCANSCDYSTLLNAVKDLMAKGINGKTIIEIKAGAYNESVSIGGISGLSSTNTLTFKGAGAKPTDTRIYNYNPYVIEIAFLSYVTLENLHIDQLTTSSGGYRALDINNAKNCTIKNCKITTYAGTTSYSELFPLRVSHSINNTFENNHFRGGYAGVNEGGWNTGCSTNVYKKNLFTKFYTYGLLASYSVNNIYEGNTIDSAVSTTASALISREETGAIYRNNMLILNNMYYGGYFMLKGNLEFTNNMIFGTSATYYGMYFYMTNASASLKIFHNTIHSSNANGYLVYLYNSYNVEVDFRNNNLTRNAAAPVLFYYGRTARDKFEGNNYYRTGTGTLLYMDANYSSLAAYKAAMKTYNIGQTDQSITVKYKSSSDLHVDQSSAVPFGRNIGITTDFDGDSRCDLFVTSGADESTYSGTPHNKKPVSPQFTGSDTVYVGNPSTFLNAASSNDPFLYKWYIDDKLVSDSIHLVTTAFTSTGNKVKLVAYNCGGKDSSEITITVMTPTKAPVADFISDITAIKQGNTVKFTDVSANYPSGWKWEITPEHVMVNGIKTETYTVIYGSLTQPNPHIKFNLPGKYKVCLTASNMNGTSSAECKTDYIEVFGTVNMSSSATVTASKGFIYDNGGPINNYSGNYNSRNKLLIDACADSIFLVFNKFDLQCGSDFINVYEGKDNTGTNLFSKCAKTLTAIGQGYTGGPSSINCSGYGFIPGCFPSQTDTLKAKGTMFIEMGIYGYSPMPGFEAYYWTTPSKEKAPVAKFFSQDTMCINSLNTFINESSGDNVKYLWDMDGDLSAFEYTVKNPEWPYYLSGQVVVTLIAENCGGIDTFSKTITVINPPLPKAAFSADNTNPTTADIVFFSPQVKECVGVYKWSFAAAGGTGKAVFVNGTKSTSSNPQVTFTDTGCYSATLYVANATGDDSLTMSCYMYVKAPYCIPAVNALTADIGISKVSFRNISNATDQATINYNNYLPQLQHSAIIEEGVSYNLTVERKTNKNKATRTVWIDWNLDGDFTDSLELVAQEINTSNLSWSTNIKMPSIAQHGASVMRIGIDVGMQKASPCGLNQTGEFEDYRLYLRAYTTKPVISLHGIDTVVIQRGYTYKDTTVSASSLRFGDVTKSIVKTMPPAGFNTLKGVYYIKYDVADTAGNKAVTAIRTIIVIADTTAPEVTIAGSDTVLHQVFTPFYQPAVLRAYDVADTTNVSINITHNVNTSILGLYMVTYTVTDMSNNAAVVTRYIKVVDTIMPILTLYGIDTVLHQAGKQYTDMGVKVIDNYFSEAELRNNLLIQSNVDVNIIGNYTVVYTLTDPSSGKKLSVTRVVLVRDTEKPQLQLIGDATDTLDVYVKYNDPGIKITDNFDNNPKLRVEGSFYTSFPNGTATQLGSYQIVYTVTDASGNTSKLSRNVVVADRKAPVLKLKGEQTVSICRWAIYTDAGVNISDNYNDTTELIIEQEGNFLKDGTGWDGIYSLRYKATDKSGNVGYSEPRYIYVRNPYAFPCSTNVSVGADVSIDKLINVYPNPNQGKFTVEANLPATEQVRISVTNMLGQEVAVISNGALSRNTFSVDITSQKAGVYLLNIVTDKQTLTRRIVVTK